MNKQKKSKGQTVILLIILILLMAILFMFFELSKEVKMNDSPINGNTTGNLNNSGLFCEHDGILYFSNGYDNQALYSYNPDNGSCKKLADGPVCNINVDSHYIYYTREASGSQGTFGLSTAAFKGLYRMELNGTKKTCIYNGSIGSAQLINNKIFFQNYSNDYGFHLYSVGIDGTKITEVLAEAVNPTGYYDNFLIFANTNDNHYVTKMDPETEQTETLYEGNCYAPIIQDNCLYYMDIGDNYSLAKVDLTTQEKITLTTERLDTYNIYGDTIFYQVSDSERPCLKRMKTDGSNIELVANGIFNSINITENYTYFVAYNSTSPIYRTPTTGTVDVTIFKEAFDVIE